jgi:hypothetical protein
MTNEQLAILIHGYLEDGIEALTLQSAVRRENMAEERRPSKLCEVAQFGKSR